MNTRSHLKLLVLMSLVSVNLLCSLEFGNLAGNSSSVGPTKIAGVVNDINGPAEGVVVTLYPSEFNPVNGQVTNSLRTITGKTGEYRFSVTEAGKYNVHAINPENRTAALVQLFEIPDSSDTMVTVPSANLQVTASTIFPFSMLSYESGGYVYIPGTGTSVIVTDEDVYNGYLVMDGVPAGQYAVVYYTPPLKTAGTNILENEISFLPGEAKILGPYAAWSRSVKIFLNTTSTGAAITNDVYNFPLLVRLNPSIQITEFVMKNAQSNGADLRFTKSDGVTPLPYQIEKWNATLQHAEIWVKIDTVFANTSTQSIIMHFGKPDAISASNGPAVFDIRDGFMGVWHLGEAAGSNAVDATGNGYDGVPSPSSPMITNGRIGFGKKFNGQNHYITMPNTASSAIDFPENGDYSVSAWVSPDPPETPRVGILSKGSTQYSLEIQNANRWAFAEFTSMAGWNVAWSTRQIDFSIVTPKTWFLVTGIRSGDRHILYVNDVLCTDSINKFIASVKSRLTSFDLSIGRIEDIGAASPCYFGGEIDEVRISSVALTKDWVALCFINQNIGNRLVTFR